MTQKILSLAICAFCVSCDLNDGDSEVDTDSSVDTDTDTDVDTDTDSDSDTDGLIENEWGFSIRLPQTRTLTCEDLEDNVWDWETDDADWLCTFDQGGVSGVLYTRNTPVECLVMTSEQAIYENQAAQMWIDGELHSVHGVLYDWGGNHKNDSLDFEFNELKLRYYHSSFGFGWRVCQNMDCIQVLSEDDTVAEDGCTCDRTLPAVCRRIGMDGELDELEDTFQLCPGDDTCV